MSNDNTPQRPWSPGPWTVRRTAAKTIVAVGKTKFVCGAGHVATANARAIATFPELYEAAAAYREAVQEFDFASSNLIGGARTQEEYGELQDGYESAGQMLAKAQMRLDAALLEAIPPEDDDE